jgi:hypothetical protein
MLSSGIVILILVVLSALSVAWHRHRFHPRPDLAGCDGAILADEEIDITQPPLPPVHVVVNAYTDQISTNPPDPLMLEDVSELPYPKDLIRLSLQAALKGTMNEKRQAELRASYMMLADYQEGVDVAVPDNGWSSHREYAMPAGIPPVPEDIHTVSPDLIVEVGEEGDDYTNIYKRWENERQQLTAELIELQLH